VTVTTDCATVTVTVVASALQPVVELAEAAKAVALPEICIMLDSDVETELAAESEEVLATLALG